MKTLFFTLFGTLIFPLAIISASPANSSFDWRLTSSPSLKLQPPTFRLTSTEWLISGLVKKTAPYGKPVSPHVHLLIFNTNHQLIAHHTTTLSAAQLNRSQPLHKAAYTFRFPIPPEKIGFMQLIAHTSHSAELCH